MTGTAAPREVVLTTGEPALAENEVIAQGVVNSVVQQTDVSPIEREISRATTS